MKKIGMFIEVINAGSIELANRPHVVVGGTDIAIACRLRVGEASIPVTSDLVEGRLPEEVIMEATLSSPSINPVFLSKCGKINDIEMYILSTDGLEYASSLFYPGEMRMLEKKLGEGYIVIPSSIHEFLIIPDSDAISADNLAQIIKDVNGDKSLIKPEEILSYIPYHYADGVFEAFASYTERKKKAEAGK